MHFPTVERLDEWCAAHEVDEAIIGGFFLRDPYRPLGELWIDGRQVPGDAIPAPYDARRACVLATGTDVRLLPREEAPVSPVGDLLQAGPLLVDGGAVVFDVEADREGFTAGSGQFDSDITDGRHPRAALGVAEDFLDRRCVRRPSLAGGRGALAARARSGAWSSWAPRSAINLDGGGSTTLVHRRHLLNRPYSSQDQAAPESRPIVSALVSSRTADARRAATRRASRPGPSASRGCPG